MCSASSHYKAENSHTFSAYIRKPPGKAKACRREEEGNSVTIWLECPHKIAQQAQREAKLERIRQREEEALSITKALHPMVANGRASEAELRRAMKAAKAMVSMTSQVAKEFAQHSES